MSWLLLIAAFGLGLQIDDPKVVDVAVQRGVQYHLLTALGAIVFATLVHALVLTYFMGTGRWLEETSSAYRLDARFYQESKTLKYRTIPALVGAFVLLVVTGAFGAAADPGSPAQFAGWFGLSAATIHQISAIVTLTVNACVNYLEFTSLFRNSEIIDQAMQAVREIRLAEAAVR
ncbi:MAG: hypothetical protein U0872_02200 [Planctomycetaceae bacterium]